MRTKTKLVFKTRGDEMLLLCCSCSFVIYIYVRVIGSDQFLNAHFILRSSYACIIHNNVALYVVSLWKGQLTFNVH